jgi:dephospho-CoA kinase
MGKGFVIGLTGGLGTGKTSVALILQSLGMKMINTDQIGHQLLKPGTVVYEKVKAAFGSEIVRADGEIDRAALGKIVFKNPTARQRLNALTHPAIIARMKAEVEELRRRGEDVVVEIPLFFEAKMTKEEAGLDEIWVVATSPGTQLARVMARDGSTEEETWRRMAAQLPLGEKMSRADVVVYNEGKQTDLKEEVQRLLMARKRAHNFPIDA